MRAKKDCFVKACSSSFHENNDEDLKVIDVSPIKSLFCNMNLDNDGIEDESTLVKRRPNNSELLDHYWNLALCHLPWQMAKAWSADGKGFAICQQMANSLCETLPAKPSLPSAG